MPVQFCYRILQFLHDVCHNEDLGRGLLFALLLKEYGFVPSVSSTSESPSAEIKSHSRSLHLPCLLKSILKSPPIIMFSQSYDLHSERISAIISMNSSFDFFLLSGLQGIYTFITKN